MELQREMGRCTVLHGQLNTTVSVNVEKEDISKLEEEGQEYSVLT